MQELINTLNKRRIVTIYVVVLFALTSLIFNYNFNITAPIYFDGEYNIYIANGLIIYKVIELIIIYYFLFHRYLIKLRSITYTIEDYPKLKKHTNLLLFLIPQGNTIFGIIAYKLSGSVLYFLLFSCIALVTLILVKPNTLSLANKIQNLK
ncbi:MAG: hypothetical protein ACI9TV_000699 [Sulfurimonas sp.]|jgi:hypothetical protein